MAKIGKESGFQTQENRSLVLFLVFSSIWNPDETCSTKFWNLFKWLFDHAGIIMDQRNFRSKHSSFVFISV